MAFWFRNRNSPLEPSQLNAGSSAKCGDKHCGGLRVTSTCSTSSICCLPLLLIVANSTQLKLGQGNPEDRWNRSLKVQEVPDFGNLARSHFNIFSWSLAGARRTCAINLIVSGRFKVKFEAPSLHTEQIARKLFGLSSLPFDLSMIWPKCDRV